MQSENLTFTFIIVAPPSTTGTVKILLNDSEVLSSSMVVGRNNISSEVTLNFKTEYEIKVAVDATNPVRLENVTLTWNESNEYYDPYWMDRDMSPNVVWDYKNEEAGKAYMTSHKGPGVRTIPLDYETDGRASFLRNYGIVTANGITSDIKNEKGPYTFKGPSSFALCLRAPVSYWLLERLFTAI
jgi:hypothetical protein